jgi:hypothetical protein
MQTLSEVSVPERNLRSMKPAHVSERSSLPAPVISSNERDNHEDEPDYERDVNETAQCVSADQPQKPQHQEDNADNQHYIALSAFESECQSIITTRSTIRTTARIATTLMFFSFSASEQAFRET